MNYDLIHYYLVCVFVTRCVLFYCVCIAVLHAVIAGLLASSQHPEKSCSDRPTRHRLFLVSLCLKANSEMVPSTLKLLLHADRVALTT
jgi:hypothetical protein